LEGRHIAEFIGQENFDHVKSYMDRALAGETVTYDFQGPLGDGLQRYFTVILTPDRSVDGAVTGFYSCITDLTQKVEAELEAKRTQERFETLTLNSGDAFFFHDMDQQILDVNKAASELLGYSREELLSMKAKHIDPRWAGTRFQEFLVTLEENVPQTFETSVITKHGVEVPVEVRFVKRVEAGQIFIQSLIRDRTEKRLQEQRLQNSEQQLRLIFENVEDFIATIGPDGTIESVNRTAQGVRHEDVVGGSVFDWYPEPDTRARVHSAFQELKRSGNAFEVETTDYTAPDGSVRTYYNKYLAIVREDGFYKAILIIRDITAAKHKELTEMRAILKGQESERKRLGAELHDGIGQILSSISLDVSQVKAQASTKADAEMVSELEGLATKVQAAIKEVRNISHDLMPDVLESFGLKEALKQTCASLHNRAGVKVRFEHVDLQPKYDPTVEMNLFRIAQELLNNIQKHASSGNVFVSLMDHGATLSLTVEDDGVGFDPTSESRGIGLSNVSSRVKTLSGQMDVESSPESGTMISIEIPK
jgi:PAS domain S-box-containing protein